MKQTLIIYTAPYTLKTIKKSFYPVDGEKYCYVRYNKRTKGDLQGTKWDNIILTGDKVKDISEEFFDYLKTRWV